MSLGLLGKKIGMTRVFNDARRGRACDRGRCQRERRRAGEVRPRWTATARCRSASRTRRKSTSPSRSRVISRSTGRRSSASSASSGSAMARRPDHGHRAAVRTSSRKASSWTSSAVSKGRGFQGVVKRHGFDGQPASHGSMMHRRTGSIGCRLTPGRVWKNQKMPGHMGQAQRTIQNLEVVETRVRTTTCS